MPKLFVFAIGGTGERVLRSFTMLLASGVPTFDNYEVYPIIIDYDTANADKKRTVDLLQNYNAVHEAAFTRHGIASKSSGFSNQFFAAKLCNLNGLTNYMFPFHPAKPNEKFREHIGYDSLSGNNMNTMWLLKSLYDESDRPDTELNLNMEVGFKGNPNIGSVVFHDINQAVEFTNFLGLFNPGNGDKVVVIGSLFGGTGASGIPEIVKAINGKTPEAKVATVLVLPYFAPMPSQKGDNDAIKASRFNSKTKAALSFYKDSGLMDMIHEVYYVGDPYPTKLPYCDGGANQRNEANLVELIAAMMIEHYVAGRGANKKKKGANEFKFSLDANIVIGDGGKSPRLFLRDFDDNSTKMVLDPLVELSIALKLFQNEIQSGKAKEMDFYQIINAAEGKDSIKSEVGKFYELCCALTSFYNKFQAWLKELDFEGDGSTRHENSHRFALCDMEKDYPDIILKEAVDGAAKEKTTQQKIVSFLKPRKLLTADFLLTRMNAHIKDNFNGAGHYDTKKNALRVGHEPEWVFADILHRTAVDGLNELNK